MHWYLIYTKPRQEKVALQNLEQQGYQCYLPLLPKEKLRHAPQHEQALAALGRKNGRAVQARRDPLGGWLAERV